MPYEPENSSHIRFFQRPYFTRGDSGAIMRWLLWWLAFLITTTIVEVVVVQTQRTKTRTVSISALPWVEWLTGIWWKGQIYVLAFNAVVVGFATVAWVFLTIGVGGVQLYRRNKNEDSDD